MADLNANASESNVLPIITHQTDQSNQLKVAVTLTAFSGDPQSLMVALFKERELQGMIDELVKNWKLDSGSFQLQFDSTRMPMPPIYITEENRDLISTGDVLSLDFTPQKMTGVITDGIQEGNISEFLMVKLVRCCSDKSFAEVFIASSGLEALKTYLTQNLTASGLDNKYGLALQSIVTLIEHDIVTWSSLDSQIIAIAIKVLQENKLYAGTDPTLKFKIIRLCLVVVENAISASPDGLTLIEQLQLEVSSFFEIINTGEQDIQSKCISVVNLLYSVIPDEKKKEMKSFIYKPTTRALINNKIFTAPINEELAYHLYVLQTNMFNLLHDRLMTPINPKDDVANKNVADLWQKAFEDNGVDGSAQPLPLRKGESRDLSRLGFKNTKEPLCDFAEIPPGGMALDCIIFFAQNYTADYKKVVLENSRERADDLDCPFSQASVELTRLLATDILSIGKEPGSGTSEGRTYYPMFFSKEHPFEELFCVCIQRFTKTWKEMKASSSDFTKVLMVVREQISRAMADSNKLYTFDSLKNKLNHWSFAKIEEVRQRDLEEREEQKTQAKPIRQLRSMLEPDIKEIIKQQRLNKMMAGYHFKPPGRRRDRDFVFCRLSHNAKVLQHGTADSAITPEMLHSINILDITEVKEERRENRRAELSISISVQGKEPLVLISPDLTIHHLWLDGLNALKGDPMSSEQATKDLNELLSMEIKLRLLDAEGLSIPDEAPEVPPPPPNFNFVTA